VDSKAEARKDRYRKHSAELGLLLWAVWDPIPKAPLDEYESYIPAIWRLLNDHAGVEAIAAALERITTERMGLEPAKETAAAERLVDWWYWRFDFPEDFNAAS
jgi:hypothetical protein